MTVSGERPVTNRYGDDRPSEAVVHAVAAATDRSVTDLDPLYGVVDSDSLDALLERGSSAAARFRYEGCDVRVTGTHVVVWTDDDTENSQ